MCVFVCVVIWDNEKAGLCSVCSKNETLQKLDLVGNQIGDIGAVSIGDALTYVQSRHPKISFY